MKIAIFLLSSIVFAAGKGGHGSVADLAMPFVNFCIFALVIYFALRKIVPSYFANQAENVMASYERAQVKKQEADKKLEEAEKKKNSLDSEIQGILRKAEDDGHKFTAEFKEEIQSKIEKYKVDSKLRLEAEESSMINEINEALIEEVVSKAKNKISGDTSLQSKATSKMLQGVQ